ncbi:MAG TPA: tetratricopeptide repeat protein [Thermoanaerobaculia bacterium]
MADAEARIRDLEKRVAREPGSRFFVPLAEEYRKAGRLPDAIRALEAGLAVHEGYVAARIALARVHLEAGRIDDSVTAFSKALAEDPSNLVASKALGDLHLSRGEPLEALKRYLRYRAISGDRRLDDVIRRLQAETAPAAEAPDPPQRAGEPVAIPIEPAAPMTAPAALADPMSIPPFEFAPRRPTDPHDISGIDYRRPSGPVPVPSDEPDVPSRDLSLDALASASKVEEEIVTRKIRLPVATWPFEPPAAAEAPAPPATPPATPDSEPAPPSGRVLADLYFEQEHYAEAARAYEELLAGDPGNDEVRGLRDAASSLAQSPSLPLPAGDPDRQRRLAKMELVNQWLAVIRTGAAKRSDS